MTFWLAVGAVLVGHVLFAILFYTLGRCAKAIREAGDRYFHVRLSEGDE